jgi:hypothetical protein
MNRAKALCLAAVCLLSGGSAVHADSISSTESIGYKFSPHSPQISFSNDTISVIRLLHTVGSIPISTTPTSIHTDFAAASLGAGTVSTPIELTLSGETKPVMLGTISGSVWRGGSNLSFTSVNGGTNPVTTSFDGHTFTISYSSLQQAPFLGLTAGRLNFSIVDPPSGGGGDGDGSGTTASTPEPSSLVLAGIGIPLLGVFLRRRRRAAKKNR